MAPSNAPIYGRFGAQREHSLAERCPAPRVVSQSEVRPRGEGEVENKGCVDPLSRPRRYTEGTLHKIAEWREDDEQNNDVNHVGARPPEED